MERLTVNKDDENFIRSQLRTQTATARPGADPPLKKLLKKYVVYFDALASGGREDKMANDAQKEAFLKDSVNFDLAMARTTSVVSANSGEMDAYRVDHGNVRTSISNAKGDIEALKNALDGARLERQHKEEYEGLRRLCVRYPRRETTEAANATLRGSIRELEEASESNIKVLKLRKKQFTTLLHVVNELTEELEHEGEEFDCAG